MLIYDKTVDSEYRFAVNSSMAVLIPFSFFPSQGISLHFMSQKGSLSDHQIYLADSLSPQYSSMYEMMLVRFSRDDE